MTASFNRLKAGVWHQVSDATTDIDGNEPVRSAPYEQRRDLAQRERRPVIRTRQRGVGLPCEQVRPSIASHFYKRSF